MDPESREGTEGADAQPCCGGGSAGSSCCDGAPAGSSCCGGTSDGGADAGSTQAGAACCCGPTKTGRCSWKSAAAVLIILAAVALGVYSLMTPA